MALNKETIDHINTNKREFTKMKAIFFTFIFVAVIIFTFNELIEKSEKNRKQRNKDLFNEYLRRRHAEISINNQAKESAASINVNKPILEDLYAAAYLGARTEPPKPTKKLNWSKELLHSLEWKRFEELCINLMNEQGFDAKPTKIGPDGGIDLNIYDKITGTRTAVGQCKAWRTYKVGVKPVRELLGVMAAESVNKGFFFTTNGFTEEATSFTEGKSIELIDGKRILSLIQTLPIEKSVSLLQKTTLGDYTTPTCPKCDIKMTLRRAQKGPFQGNRFWGCQNYPRCKQTFKI